eukprot:1810539-Pyramimonas_sp.AAC.1
MTHCLAVCHRQQLALQVHVFEDVHPTLPSADDENLHDAWPARVAPEVERRREAAEIELRRKVLGHVQAARLPLRVRSPLEGADCFPVGALDLLIVLVHQHVPKAGDLRARMDAHGRSRN